MKSPSEKTEATPWPPRPGNSPLLHLTEQNLEVPQELWSRESLTEEDKRGWCPLLWLVFHETLSVLPEGLLDRELVNRPLAKDNNCLHYAASWDKPVAAEYLLRHGADPLLPNGEGKNAIELAANKSQLLLKMLNRAVVTEKKRRLGQELEKPARPSI